VIGWMAVLELIFSTKASTVQEHYNRENGVFRGCGGVVLAT